jgi:phage anti-repressor protein
MEEKKTSTFQVAVARDEIAKIEKESVPDYNKNADRLYNVYKCQKLTGSWINCIRKAINEYENNDYSIIGQNGRINLERKLRELTI